MRFPHEIESRIQLYHEKILITFLEYGHILYIERCFFNEDAYSHSFLMPRALGQILTRYRK